MKKCGVSLIVLIITIIIIIILVGSVIISLANNSPVDKANEACFKLDLKTIKDDMEMYSITAFSNGKSELFPLDIYGELDSDILTSLSNYKDKLSIIDDKLTFIGTDETERQWAKEIGYSLDEEILAVEGNNILQIEAGGNFSMLLYNDSTVRSFGLNGSGQLGRDNSKSLNTPEYVMKDSSSVLNNAKKIVAGDNNCLALLEDETVLAWGDNYNGALGSDFLYSQNPIPKTITAFSNAKDIITGSLFTYILKNDNTLSYVGKYYTGPNLSGLTNIKEISCNYNSILAVCDDGTTKGWGNNESGELGVGNTYSQSTPIQTIGITSATQVVFGSNCSFFLLTDKTVKSCGQNYYGQLGDGTTVSKTTPIKINELSNVKSISAGNSHVLALLEDGTVMAWGNNQYGQLGDGTKTFKKSPVKINGLSNVVQVSAGKYHSLALLADGSLMAWGNNEYGQLGDETNIDKLTPTLINAKFDAITEPE